MRHMFVRPMRDDDLKQMVLWSGQNPAADLNVLAYPTTLKWCAFIAGEVIAYMPIQQPLMLEAIIFHPLATDTQKALAMKEICHSLITQAYASGRGEIYFVGSDISTNLFAEHQGFERLDMPVYRAKLLNLEKV